MAIAYPTRTFAQRIGYLVTCCIPADILSDESTCSEDSSSLRSDASCNGLSYIQVIRALEDHVYMARVAASPEGISHGYTVLLTEQQLYASLPWEERLEWEDHVCTQRRSPDAILALLHAHAAEVQPLTKLALEQTVAPALSSPVLTPLDTVEVTQEELQDAIKMVTHQGKNVDQKLRRTSSFLLQQALLSAAIDTLMSQLYQTQEQVHALTIKARCALLAQLQRWHRHSQHERLVNVAPRFSPEHERVVWRLTIGLPAAFSVAAGV
ncbi:MAG TPA: hypothetical protein VFB60_11390 [Ktedonobacteraceae bacterium]|nr:hypothetical protein [Ktedonobacteraceae bacterium]